MRDRGLIAPSTCQSNFLSPLNFLFYNLLLYELINFDYFTHLQLLYTFYFITPFFFKQLFVHFFLILVALVTNIVMTFKFID
jgi:hypothetical protein